MSLTVAIATYMHDPDHTLFMLDALENQTSEDFDVLVLDPYKNAATRKAVEEYNWSFEANYIPYELPAMPRKYDWTIWNLPFLISDSERIFRYQQWRLIPNNLIELIQSTDGNVGFVREEIRDLSEANFNSPWCLERRPTRAELKPFPYAVYGDWCLTARDFVAVNGIDEVSTAMCHYEDIDFEIRWKIALDHKIVSQVNCIGGVMIRVHDTGRTRLAPEAGEEDKLKKIFSRGTQSISKRGRFHGAYKFRRLDIDGWTANCQNCRDSFEALNNDTSYDTKKTRLVTVKNGQAWFECLICGGVFHKQSHPHFEVMKESMQKGKCYKATIGIRNSKGILFGRNLAKIREESLSLESLQNRYEFVFSNYQNPEFYGI